MEKQFEQLTNTCKNNFLKNLIWFYVPYTVGSLLIEFISLLFFFSLML